MVGYAGAASIFSNHVAPPPLLSPRKAATPGRSRVAGAHPDGQLISWPTAKRTRKKQRRVAFAGRVIAVFYLSWNSSWSIWVKSPNSRPSSRTSSWEGRAWDRAHGAMVVELPRYRHAPSPRPSRLTRSRPTSVKSRTWRGSYLWIFSASPGNLAQTRSAVTLGLLCQSFIAVVSFRRAANAACRPWPSRSRVQDRPTRPTSPYLDSCRP